MIDSETLQPYLGLADRLFKKEISEGQVRSDSAGFAPLDREWLDALAGQADRLAATAPRHGWAIMRVADLIAQAQHTPLLTRSLAAWYLGKAGNAWEQPRRVRAAIARARRGFVRLNELGWVAACDWQSNSLFWTLPDYNQAANTLAQALESLAFFHFDDFLPHCRLALANIQIRLGNFSAAIENIRDCETIFERANDEVNLARCWHARASCFNRLGKFDDAIVLLTNAQKFFSGQGLPIDSAKVNYALGLINLFKTEELARSIDYFEQAMTIFSQSELDLYLASCSMNLGSVYLQVGQLKKAEGLYNRSRKIFLRHGVLSLVADNLNDSGMLNLHRGRPAESIGQFQQAVQVYEGIGAKMQAAIYTANLGEAYRQLGRYQDALYYLEKSVEGLAPFQNYARLGGCEYYIALTWSQLGQIGTALAHLDQAAEFFAQSNQPSLLAAINNARADIYFDQGLLPEAVHSLEQSLATAEKYGTQPQIALARRILGEGLIQSRDFPQALDNLQQAYANFSQMGMLMEQSACLVALGSYFAHTADTGRSRQAYLDALELSAGAFAGIDWAACVGLARLAEEDGDLGSALDDYRHAEIAISRVRMNLWQPALAGSYIHAPAAVLDRSVTLAARLESYAEALFFIEESKASTLLRQLNMQTGTVQKSASREIDDLRAEIHWLQEQMRVSLENSSPLLSAPRARELRSGLIEKVRRYDELSARVERQNASGQKTLSLEAFNYEHFREQADARLKSPWLALDYYLLEKELVIIAVGADFLEGYRVPLTARVRMALDEIRKPRQAGWLPAPGDLETLGNFLFPDPVFERLNSDTVCILSPHRALHSVPWGALECGPTHTPLACNGIPGLTPSLKNLSALWDREETRVRPSVQSGQVIGLSSFQGRHPPLPSVDRELDTLIAETGSATGVLRDQKATWENMQKLAQAGRLGQLGWLHIASHVFFEPNTGRLSGIALWDGDIWLEQLRDLAPLPPLVTFSACNSMQGRLYEGDEQIGLPVTCLIAGADTVIGTIWPVLDTASTDFMLRFYQHYQAGQSPVRALAGVQREMISAGKSFSAWGGFVCLGLP